MITVWGGQTSRSIRVAWVLEEMGLPYCVRQVDMLATEKDPAWLAINPGDFLPAVQDGEVTMVESVAIMEYLMSRYGPTPLQPSPCDLAFPAYQQFLHMGEAGLATLIMVPLVSSFLAPEVRLTYSWGKGRFRPFVSGGGGFAVVRSDVVDSRWRESLTAGGGARVRLGDRVFAVGEMRLRGLNNFAASTAEWLGGIGWEVR